MARAPKQPAAPVVPSRKPESSCMQRRRRRWVRRAPGPRSRQFTRCCCAADAADAAELLRPSVRPSVRLRRFRLHMAQRPARVAPRRKASHKRRGEAWASLVPTRPGPGGPVLSPSPSLSLAPRRTSTCAKPSRFFVVVVVCVTRCVCAVTQVQCIRHRPGACAGSVALHCTDNSTQWGGSGAHTARSGESVPCHPARPQIFRPRSIVCSWNLGCCLMEWNGME